MPPTDPAPWTSARSAILRGVERWGSWLVPEALRREADVRRRAMTSVCLPLPFVVYGVAMAALHGSLGNVMQALLIVVACLFGLASCGLLRLTGSLRVSTNLQITLLLVSLIFLAWRTGTSTSSTLFVTLLVPLIAGMVLDRRSAVAWGAVVLATYGVVFALFRAGLAPPPIWSPEDLPLANLLAATFALLLLIAVTAVFEWMRSRALAELTEARARAQEASRAKSAFVANTSHEVRTPLHGMLGSLQLLRATELSAEQKLHVDTMVAAGRALLGVVDDVLDFSKIEAGRMELSSEEFDLVELLEDVASSFGAMASEGGTELVLDVEPGLVRHVAGDPQRLRQVLANLVSNAIKFTPDGAVVLRAESEGRDLPGQVTLSVIDTGAGMDPATVSELLEPFEQGSRPASLVGSGTGLGLAIASSYVELMGAELAVDTAPGRGTTMAFTLTLDVTEAPRETTQAPLKDLGVLALCACEERAAMLRRVFEAARTSHTLVADVDSLLQTLERRLADIDVVVLDVPVQGQPRALAAQVSAVSSVGLVAICSAGHRLSGDVPIDQVIPKTAAGHRLVGALAEAAEVTATDRFHLSQSTERSSSVVALMPTVLVVDDNEVNQRVARGHLDALGYTAETVSDGQEALARWREAPDDCGLILMDCHMPGLDGFEATMKIRELEAEHGWGRTPIVALTADVMPGTPARVREAGMDDYLAKPFSAGRLSSVLRRWCGTGLSDRPPTSQRSPVPAPPDRIVLDEVALDALRELGDGALQEILAVFLDNIDDHVQKAQAAFDEGDTKAMRDVAHKAKSSCRIAGATKLAEAFEALERLEPAEASAAIEELLAHAQPAKAALEELLGRAPGQSASS